MPKETDLRELTFQPTCRTNRFQENLLKHSECHTADLKPTKIQNVNINQTTSFLWLHIPFLAPACLHVKDSGFQKWQVEPKRVINSFKDQNTRSHSKFCDEYKRLEN